MTSLGGTRVVEIGTSVAAPFAGQILGDLGADVIKVERPGSGDDSRSWGPPFWDDESVAFLALNRNKRSLALDFKVPEGRKVLERLIASADVLVQNLRPGALAKAGFDPARLEELNPRLVYCDMSGFGKSGPKADAPAYDPLVQAYSGIVSLVGEEGRPPVRIPVSLLDMGTGMWTAIAVLDALATRARSGAGTRVDLSLLNTAAMWLNAPITAVLAGNGPPARLGSGHPGVVPYGAFRCADGHVFVSAGNQQLWERLCRSIDRPDLAADPRFADNPSRARHRTETGVALEEAFEEWTSAALLTALQAAGVPSEPVNSLDTVVEDPQMWESNALEEVDHPRIDGFSIINTPIAFAGEHPPYRLPPPRLGEHSAVVLGELAYDAGSCDSLIANGVVADATRTPDTT